MLFAAFGQTALPVLRKGSKGADVVRLQQMLTAAGDTTYGADGIFGTKTYNAVARFQRAKGLNADGIVGAKTWAALMASPQVASPPPAPPPAAVPPPTPAEVVAVPISTQSGTVGTAAHIIPYAPPPPSPSVTLPDATAPIETKGGKIALIIGGSAIGLALLMMLMGGKKKTPAMAGYKRRRLGQMPG